MLHKSQHSWITLVVAGVNAWSTVHISHCESEMHLYTYFYYLRFTSTKVCLMSTYKEKRKWKENRIQYNMTKILYTILLFYDALCGGILSQSSLARDFLTQSMMPSQSFSSTTHSVSVSMLLGTEWGERRFPCVWQAFIVLQCSASSSRILTNTSYKLSALGYGKQWAAL